MERDAANKTLDDVMNTLEKLDNNLYESGSLKALDNADREKALDCMEAIEDVIFVLSRILKKHGKKAA